MYRVSLKIVCLFCQLLHIQIANVRQDLKNSGNLLHDKFKDFVNDLEIAEIIEVTVTVVLLLRN